MNANKIREIETILHEADIFGTAPDGAGGRRTRTLLERVQELAERAKRPEPVKAVRVGEHVVRLTDIRSVAWQPAPIAGNTRPTAEVSAWIDDGERRFQASGPMPTDEAARARRDEIVAALGWEVV